MNQFTYIGTELELFASATNWKNYIKSLLKKYIRGNILEVGAGIGSQTKLLSRAQYDQWICLEPDLKLFQILESTIQQNRIANCKAIQGTLDSLDAGTRFDLILYLDVLEHIKNDKEEVIKAFEHLQIGGNLIVLGPAHQWLFTPFDASIGHYRRYDKSMLRVLAPRKLEVTELAYLDCVGLLASLGNKLVLKQSQPTLQQIKTWDQLMVPISKQLDPILRYSLGKSILFVGRKNAD